MTLQEAIDAGVAHHHAGRLAEAEKAYRAVLAVDPAHADALNLLGMIAYATKHFREAMELTLRALRREPDNAVFLNNHSQALRELGRYGEAIEALRRAVRINGTLPQVRHNLGALLSEAGDAAAAEQEFAALLRLTPGDAMAHTDHGNTLHDCGRLEEALEAHRAALRIDPNLAEGHNNMSAVLRDMDRPDEALQAAEAALRLRPGYDLAMSTMASALYDLDRPRECIEWSQRAIEVSPKLAIAHRNKGMALLALGDFANGWPGYEWRELPRMETIPGQAAPPPRWDGSPLDGRRIAVLFEQGFGDAILAARYARMLSEPPYGGVVIWVCPEPLRKLLETAPGISEVSSTLPTVPVHAYIPMGSLGMLLGVGAETIPAPVPYLFADAQRAAYWRKRMQEADAAAKLRVGLTWASRPGTVDARRRSMALRDFAPLADAIGATFYSLQKDEPAKEAAHRPAGMRLVDWTAELGDFAETAALVDALDLVITVDTAICNLAGAMAKPTWTMVPWVSDWRWMRSWRDTPWYPTMRLFRQASRGDWAAVVADVARELKDLIKRGCA